MELLKYLNNELNDEDNWIANPPIFQFESNHETIKQIQKQITEALRIPENYFEEVIPRAYRPRR